MKMINICSLEHGLAHVDYVYEPVPDPVEHAAQPIPGRHDAGLPERLLERLEPGNPRELVPRPQPQNRAADPCSERYQADPDHVLQWPLVLLGLASHVHGCQHEASFSQQQYRGPDDQFQRGCPAEAEHQEEDDRSQPHEHPRGRQTHLVVHPGIARFPHRVAGVTPSR